MKLCLLFLFSDACKKQPCKFYSKCFKKSDDTTECVCPICNENEKYSPLCGDDGMTYANQCELEGTACKEKREIKILKRQSCGKIL